MFQSENTCAWCPTGKIKEDRINSLSHGICNYHLFKMKAKLQKRKFKRLYITFKLKIKNMTDSLSLEGLHISH